MKNTFKLGLLTLVVSLSVIACDPDPKNTNSTDSLAVDSSAVPADTTAADHTAVDSAAKDTLATDTAK